MNTGRNKSVIEMKCFGQFDLTFEGKSLLKGKTKESQISLLLQYLLHEGKKGVSRERLEEVLFDKREVDNKHHALQSVVYNTKKKLQAAGVPKVNYILHKDGMFFWNEEVAVREDAKEFEEMYQKAEAEKDIDKKLEYYYEACHMYAGEFLPTYNMLAWVAAEARRYQEIFDSCVKKSIELLKERTNYRRIAEIGEYAAQRVKHEEYEMLAMDALLTMGNYQEAKAFYRRVEKQYMEIQTQDPMQVYDDYIERLAEKITNSIESLDVIQERLSVMHEGGAYFCSYPVFKGIYQLIKLSFARSELIVSLMLCTLVDSNGKPLKRSKVSRELTEQLKSSICDSVRKGDVITKYNYGQYLILLGGSPEERCDQIQKRINDLFESREKSCKVSYVFSKIS